ncbi:cleavage stimulation factor subunit 77 [Brassica napus]|uniref:cleavage stimulation factor subunit 77 n=1 Tax=Brassica napus TaxID=3708 RepID=UPI0006AB6188|nr:cleavage stimulation factor subunit 77 [Brassica napus]XP_013684925.1 cleavage stimulation factor subunit 77 [Brassica napus]XP_022554906.1 cleavage stimulation factor subunit 77 [Brassica napus]
MIIRWKKLSIIGDLQLQQQLKVELMVSSRWCCGVGYISFRSVVLKVEKTNIPHGSATIGSVASSSKVVYPDTAQMIVYDPTKKSEFSSSVKPMAASASNTFQSNVTATATHVSANTFDEIPKTTPPALLAFLANLPHVDEFHGGCGSYGSTANRCRSASPADYVFSNGPQVSRGWRNN